MSQKLPVNNFEWIKDTSQFNEDFTKIIMRKVINGIFLMWMKSIFLKLMFNILKNYMNFINDLSFLPDRMKIGNVERLVANLHDNLNHRKFKSSIKS